MKVEIFYAPGCSDCAAAQIELRTAAQETVQEVEWLELNILDEIDHAVDLGVITLPSIVIDGKLEFTSMPTVEQLRRALIQRVQGRT
ncbi:MAG: thioredoxin family protein [Rhizobiales bacterium]|nr:thioredoxin family protein [Hyphomicrobiales bacterium]MBN9588488.1 thioredoxin family protein [Alphaproteobacteria bacterium]